jgi:HEAT repeat protein
LGEPGPSGEAERCLAVAGDPKQDIQTRVAAIIRIRELDEEATVPYLVKMLPDPSEHFTRHVIIALGVMGRPSALPALERIYRDPKLQLSGKTRASLIAAIRYCGGKP